MSCASLSWPPTRLQSQADQSWTFAYVKNHQLHYACIGPVKSHIIKRLKKVPPSNVFTYQCRFALDSCVTSSSDTEMIFYPSALRPRWQTCQYSWHLSTSPFLATPALFSPLPQNNGKERKLWRGPTSTLLSTHSSILAWRIPWTEEPDVLTVHRVTPSQTRLERLSTHAHGLI